MEFAFLCDTITYSHLNSVGEEKNYTFKSSNVTDVNHLLTMINNISRSDYIVCSMTNGKIPIIDNDDSTEPIIKNRIIKFKDIVTLDIINSN